MARVTPHHQASIEAARSRARIEPVQLSIWPERVRALPNTLARCALFTAAGKKEPRAQLKRQQLVTLAGAELSYTGEELRQDDQDVWLQVVHTARQHPLGDRVELSGHSIIRALGWGRSADCYARLRASLMRMTECTVWSTQEGRNPWSGRLIHETRLHGELGTGDGTWALQLDPKIVALFAPNGVSLVEWEQRLTLKPLAKWLHSFYSTHANPYPYRVPTLHQLCGSKSSRMSHFRAGLLGSLDELVEAGFLDSWARDTRTDTVSVVRRPRAAALPA